MVLKQYIRENFHSNSKLRGNLVALDNLPVFIRKVSEDRAQNIIKRREVSRKSSNASLEAKRHGFSHLNKFVNQEGIDH